MTRSFVVSLLFVAISATAVQPLASTELLERCAGEAAGDAQSCQSWLHGFIGGAYATRVARHGEPKQRETYSDRAARTRMTRGRLVYGRNQEAGYCMPTETTLEEVVAKLTAYAASLKEIPEHANQLMLGMLRKEYPCQTSSAPR